MQQNARRQTLEDLCLKIRLQ